LDFDNSKFILHLKNIITFNLKLREMKSIILILVICLNIVSNAFSQEIRWQNTIGGDKVDDFRSIQKTSDNGFILSGNSNSNISGDKTESSIGGIDFWIIKVDSLGLIQWQKVIGGTDVDAVIMVKQTTDGGYVLGGYSKSVISGDKTEACLGGYDYWILKTDNLGNIQWQNTIGGSDADYLTSIQQSSDGGYILGGYSKSYISGDKTENLLGGYDYWILKLDSQGVIQWQNTIGGNQDDYLMNIQQTYDGGYILGGTSFSSISFDKTENCMGNFDYWIVKVDFQGNIQWQNTIGGSNPDELFSIQQTADGGYALGGTSSSNISGDKTESCRGYQDFWIVKIDSLGSLQWQKTLGGDSYDNLRSIKLMDSGDFILGGDSWSNLSGEKAEGVIGITGYSGIDYWVVMIDSIGNIKWQNTIGGSDADHFSELIQTNDMEFVLGGTSESVASYDKTENCIGDMDFWILKITDKYNLINGKLYADVDGNGIQDLNETSLQGVKVTEQNTGRFTFSRTNGEYSLSILDTGNYSVSPGVQTWYIPSPVIQSAFFTNINQVDSLNDFGYQPTGVYDDASVTLTPLGLFRIGSITKYQITYANYGTTTIAPTVIFYPDTNLIFQSASITPSQITLDSVIWNLPAIVPFQTNSIIVNVSVNLTTTIGTVINSSVRIEPLITDSNVSNNSSIWTDVATNSFDPNDIIVNRSELTPTELSASPWLDYIVRFQNTGNDTAFTVKILNPIDTNKLNISTIEFVNSSHPVNLNWINYQRNMEFKFDNILLPDSNVNEPLSHGFVHYRIKPKSNLVVGDTIKNFAAIYFDFNEPVITNTAQTVIVSPTGLSSLSSLGKLAVYPNPAQSKININSIKLENGKALLRLFDLYGKLILEKNITTANPEVDIQYLPAGMYLLQSGNQRATFVKQ
jgi:hypothetical protein